MQSEDIGARRESVSRSKGEGGLDVVQGKQLLIARWTKDVDCSGLLLKNSAEEFIADSRVIRTLRVAKSKETAGTTCEIRNSDLEPCPS